MCSRSEICVLHVCVCVYVDIAVMCDVMSTVGRLGDDEKPWVAGSPAWLHAMMTKECRLDSASAPTYGPAPVWCQRNATDLASPCI